LQEKAYSIGLTDTELLDYDSLQNKEPQTKINGLGAIFFKCDAHLYPNKLMQQLIAHLKNVGVIFQTDEEVISFENKNGSITKVITDKNFFH